MSADAFAVAMAWVLAAEGGGKFVDDKSDAGGATRWGICESTLAHWRVMQGEMQPVTTQTVQSLTQYEAELIYRSLYWNYIQGDHLADAHLACALMDTAVLCGVGTATKLAQGLLGLAQDGVFGPHTLAAVNGQRAAAFVPLYVAALKDYLYRVVQQKPTNSKFYAGWIHRADDLLKLAI